MLRDRFWHSNYDKSSQHNGSKPDISFFKHSESLFIGCRGNARDEKGLFNTDLSGKSKDERKWLLTQAAMVEMFARLATIQ